MAYKYSVDTSTVAHLVEHLTVCDADFIPVLSSTVDIVTYAAKLVKHSVRYEAWNTEDLVAVVAVYFDGVDKSAAYITSVSVHPTHRGKGIATVLLGSVIERATSLNKSSVSLEVGRENVPAQRAYSGLGFVVIQDCGSSIMMKRRLRVGNDDE